MQNFQESKSLIQFEPAQLFNKSLWYVQYKVVNPYSGKMVIKRIKLTRIKPISERKKYAKSLIQSINQKLYSGWNPFLEEEAEKGFHLLVDAIDIFFKRKSKELRPDSIRSYKSYVKYINDWLRDNDMLDTYVLTFNKSHAIKILDYAYDVKNVSNKTYNNYLLFFKTLWNWLKEKEYCKTSPFETIKPKKKETKERILIPEDTRTKIKQYFSNHNYQMYIASLLVFHTLIRPKEISYLKKKHFDFENQVIIIPNTVAKSHQMRVATIPDVILGELISFNYNGANDQDFIFGLRGRPSREKMDSREFSREWSKMRKKLGLDLKMKFYSLRDSGIVQLLIDGVSPHEVMKQAGHANLETTTIYLKHANPNGSNEIKEKNSSF